MPFALFSDTLGRDPRWFALAGDRPVLRDRLQAAYMRLKLESASHLHDGYLTRRQALNLCDAKLLDLLCTPVLGEKPFLHREGDTCDERNCLDDSGPWVEGFDYRVCGFIKRNPTRAEYNRNQAQKADSRDGRLRAAVYDRDGGCCRYCGSGPLRKKGMGRAKDRRRALQYDHVDPDKAAGADGANYVVACARCNEAKGHRTPDEAGMRLLSPPTDEQRAAWQQRGEALFDLPDEPSDNDNDNAHDNAPDNQHDNAHDYERALSPATGPDNESAGDVRVETAAQPQRQAATMSPEGSGSGRVGQRDRDALPRSSRQPARRPDAPDIYHRRSRDPAPDFTELAEDQEQRCVHGQPLDDDCELCLHAQADRGEPP
ncbi:HNH endonuclease [Prauserella muralis]|uniref:Uncharacterized protein n=1 Tax=Prauserella muralis TaxID=588067 RepID=A0A2V4AMD4_9PSEU|nr:HNH endonuclease [Prauserella muralis]PXY21144.1 hypothetical protein BAY60_27135 [Prauserella muralis]TWE30232.1 hypothetical protein FHX69_2929 [Prauserella muralis]